MNEYFVQNIISENKVEEFGNYHQKENHCIHPVFPDKLTRMEIIEYPQQVFENIEPDTETDHQPDGVHRFRRLFESVVINDGNQGGQGEDQRSPGEDREHPVLT